LLDRCIACDQINCLTYFNEELKVLSCNDCGALFTEKRSNPKTHYFREGRAPTFLEKVKTKMTHVRFWKLLSDEYVRYLKSKTDMNFKNTLDIGTHYGSFVAQLNKLGIDAHGIEANAEYVKFAVTKKIEWDYFDESYQSNKKYDLICLTQMLYYLPDSYSILRHTKNMLTDNGLIFIATVNPQSSLVKNGLVPSLGGDFANIMLSKKNFESLKTKLGLEMIDFTTYRTPLFIDIHSSKNKKIKIAKYILKLKKAYVPDPDGEHIFLLLRKINKL